MQTKDLDTLSASNKWFAARDARMRNYIKSSLYNEVEKLKAERMRLGLGLVYSTKDIHINYRDRFIAIKLDNPTVKDNKTLRLLESDYAKQGIIKRTSSQGVIYRIPKV